MRLSVSYHVFAWQTHLVRADPFLEIDLSMPQPQRHIVRSEAQVRACGHLFRQVLDRLAREQPELERIHLCYAGPVALAFHLGQHISATIHPPITVWNFSRGYDWGLDLAAAALRQPCVITLLVGQQGSKQ